MNFVLYLILCVLEVFGTMVGGSTGHHKMAGWGVLILFVILVVWGLTIFGLTRTRLNYKWAYLLSVVITVGFIVLFCVISIIVELLIGKA